MKNKGIENKLAEKYTIPDEAFENNNICAKEGHVPKYTGVINDNNGIPMKEYFCGRCKCYSAEPLSDSELKSHYDSLNQSMTI